MYQIQWITNSKRWPSSIFFAYLSLEEKKKTCPSKIGQTIVCVLNVWLSVECCWRKTLHKRYKATIDLSQFFTTQSKENFKNKHELNVGIGTTVSFTILCATW